MENDGYDFVRILFPNVSLFLAPEITQLAQLFPGPTPDKNKTVLTFFRREGPRDDDDKTALEGMMDWLKTVVRDEDYEIGLKIQQGLACLRRARVDRPRPERAGRFTSALPAARIQRSVSRCRRPSSRIAARVLPA